MSRVDEALRRASGSTVESVQQTESAAASFHDFPVEDRRTVSARPPAPRGRELPKSSLVVPRTAGRYSLSSLAADVDGKTVIDADISPASVEEYRRLGTALHLMQTQSGIQALMVSSALPREGKTLTSTNLALTLSESYKKRVLLIDADLRRPSVHEVFGLPNTVGLADGLRGEGPISIPFIEVSDYLTVLPAGTADASPIAGLTSERMRTVVTDARARFDWVILDTPPVGFISDANVLASLVDGVLLVIGAGATPYAAITRAVSEFGRERIIGVVLNRVNHEVAGEKYYADYYDPRGQEADRT